MQKTFWPLRSTVDSSYPISFAYLYATLLELGMNFLKVFLSFPAATDKKIENSARQDVQRLGYWIFLHFLLYPEVIGAPSQQ